MKNSQKNKHLMASELNVQIANDLKKIENSLSALKRKLQLLEDAKEDVIVFGEDLTIIDVIDIYAPSISKEKKIILFKMIKEAKYELSQFGSETLHDQLSWIIKPEEYFSECPEILEFIKKNC